MPLLAGPGLRSQTAMDDLLDFSGVITAGGTAQLLLPQQPGRSNIFISNNSSAFLWVEQGPARCSVTVSSGSLASPTITNGGLGYTVAPQVRFLGGVVAGDLGNAPSHPARGHVTISAGAVATFVLDDPGLGYVVAPYVYLENPLPVLGGGAAAAANGTGIGLPPTTSIAFTGILVPAGAFSIWGGTTNQAFCCKVGGLV